MVSIYLCPERVHASVINLLTYTNILESESDRGKLLMIKLRGMVGTLLGGAALCASLLILIAPILLERMGSKLAGERATSH